ncbi:MAG: bifunctional 4-hydroxy-2-oxoglutarate aldolase/2-dehydro-3-deoxy-phosphogluconate aldolase [Cellvibrionaceae bacterium]
MTTTSAISIESVVNKAPVIPVIVIENLEHAVPLARALYNGGLSVLEITLRTEMALPAIEKIRTELPEAIVGAGTVNSAKHLQDAVAAGSSFLVSPGSTASLLDAAEKQEVPLLPGAATPSEVMNLLERGFYYQKFFPAEAAGGVPMLKSIGGPLAQVNFCPTGGIDIEKAKNYLALKNVSCVGGSWMAAPGLVNDERWSDIEALAKAASQIRSQ